MGIILIFMAAGAVAACVVTSAVAAGMTVASLYLTRHHPAWGWAAAALLVVYGSTLLYWYWTATWSDSDVPEGLRALWNQVGAVVGMWPLPPALIALAGAGVVLFARW